MNKVLLIGNAETVLEKIRLNIDNDFDIIVRLNYGFRVQGKEQFIGARTDVLGFSDPALKTEISGAKACWYLTPRFRNKVQKTKNLCIYPISRWERLNAELKARPSSGIMMADVLLNILGIETIYSIGFDFFESRSWYDLSDTRLAKDLPHDAEAEKAWFNNKKSAGRIRDYEGN